MDIYDKANLQNDSNSMILMHLNIRPLQKNYDDLYDLVASLSFRPDVICLSESRINQPLKSIQPQGYNFINAKPNKNAGGTAIYVCSKLKFSQIDVFGLTGSESIWLKIWKNDSTKALVIASIYRHPSEDINQFIFDFSDCLEKLSNEKRNFYIVGDININIIVTNQLSPQAEKYLQAITSNGAFSLITKSTRVTDKSATVIDHIIINDVEHTVMPCVILSSITHHYAAMYKLVKFKQVIIKHHSRSTEIKKKFARKLFLMN